MYEKILITTDGSDLAAEAFPHAACLAAADAEVLLLSVIDGVARVLSATNVGAGELAGPVGVATATESIEAQREAVEANLERHADVLRALGLRSVRTRIVGGNAGEEIVNCAEQEGAEIIVMATHGRSGWRRAILGSVADHVARHAPGIPVLLVHPTPES
ncbi:MAG: universal stress protein [Chloroflexi bacterium]|nr:universal stress protein [Chloroflexota bacterium]